MSIYDYTASEARRTANNQSPHKTKLGEILEDIKKAADQGEHQLYYYEELPFYVQKELKNRGFLITPFFKDDAKAIINW